MTLRPSEVVVRGERYLAAHGIEDARPDAEWLMMHVLGVDRAGIYARSAPLTPAEARNFGRALCRRCDGVPVQHLTGRQPFRGLDLEVRPGVFIPRQETEVLVDAVVGCLRGEPAPVVVDVGTGTGAIALAVKQERPDAVVHATDVSEPAIELARSNASRLGIDVSFHFGPFLEAVPTALRGRVACVVSNPPYITPQEYRSLSAEVLADPLGALVGGMDVYRDLADAAGVWAAPGGWLVVEIGAAQGLEVAAILSEAWGSIGVLPDLAGRDRIVLGRKP